MTPLPPVIVVNTPACQPVACAATAQTTEIRGPRYTSYPTADRFHSHFSDAHYLCAIALRKADPTRADAPLSLYVHIPFCESVCYYCACNKVVTKHHDRAATYLRYLIHELTLQIEAIGPARPLNQLHVGGGTPTFLSDDELATLMSWLRSGFRFLPDAEISIEVDPRTVGTDRLAHLAAIGFNRISFGIQDFDPAVQQAVHREQPREQVVELVEHARALGFRSINVDLIHGLPKQTEASFARTIDSIVALRPDRIAVYAYAHLPQRFKPQRRIAEADLPDAATRRRIAEQTLTALTRAGYVYIGMDHFALPGDGLAIARRNGTLHRNFQGYSTHADSDQIGLGASAIAKVGDVYSQNASRLEDYYRRLDEGRLPIARGRTLSADDRVRREVIMALMCQGSIDRDAVSARYGIDFDRHFAAELQALRPSVETGLLRDEGRHLVVTEEGWYRVRSLAMVFDAYLRDQAAAATYSRVA